MAERDDDQELTTEERAAAQAQAVKRKKRLIYGAVVAAVLVLVSAGIIIWLLLYEPDPQIQAAQAAQNPEAVAQRAIYYPLGQNFTMNYDVRGRQRYLQVQVTLMLRDNAAVQSIEMHQPSIRNNLVGLFSGQVFEDLQTPEGRELLRQDALRGVQSVLEQEIGRPVVEQVLFTHFVMQ